MWWQMKPTRFNGAFTAGAGLLVAIALGYGMFRLIYY